MKSILIKDTSKEECEMIIRQSLDCGAGFPIKVYNNPKKILGIKGRYMNKISINRILLYIIGMLVLALGLSLNIRTDLGVSAIMSVPYSISEIFSLNVGNITLLAYAIFVALQFLINGPYRRWYDILQIPLSIVFTRVLNLFLSVLPTAPENYTMRFLLLFVAIILTGIGAAMTVNMDLIANPGDAIVHAIARRVNKPMGFVKNMFDISCVLLTVLISFLLTGKIIGVGVGTICAMLGVGRVIFIFNKLFKYSEIR